MKKTVITALTVVGLLCTGNMLAQEGIGTNLPEKSAALEIRSEQRGLLIPRFDIPDLNDAAPVNNPANALMVYNLGDNPGFYYWSEAENKWTPIGTSEISGGNNTGDLDLVEGELINISTNSDDKTEISFAPGTGNIGEVLVIRDDGNGEPEPAWIDRGEFMALFEIIEGGGADIDVIGENGIEIILNDDGDYVVRLGKNPLTDPTEIITDGNDFTITGLDDMEGLEEVNTDDTYVVLMNEDEALRRMTLTEFLNETDELEVSFKNGLERDSDDNVMLGGELTEEKTIIEASDENLFGISGLKNFEDLDEVDTEVTKVLLTNEDNVLQTMTLNEILSEAEESDVERAFSKDVSSSIKIDDFDEYSSDVQEINITVETNSLGSGDIDLTLPSSADAAEGQVINVKLTGNTEASNYLNIKIGSNDLTYGALPHQAWIIKSNGEQWQIVASY